MSNRSTTKRKAKFSKLSDDLNIKLVNGNRNFIIYRKNDINNGKVLIKSLLI